MTEKQKDSNDGVEFRRQLTATLLGALIAMSTSAGIAIFQWRTQTRDREHQQRVESLSQFASEVSNAMSTAAGTWHLANKCDLVVDRASRLAARTDLAKSDSMQQYKELVATAWEVESELAESLQEAARRRAATSAAYYKLLASFNDMQPTSYALQTEPLSPWIILSDAPDKVQLQRLAEFLTAWSKRLRDETQGIAQSYAGWSEQVRLFAVRAQQ